MNLTFAGKFWTLYVVFLLLLVLAVRALAADADVNGFQFHEPRVSHPCYQGEVIDCMELIGQPGSLAYCDWAAKIAIYGAWVREDRSEAKLYPDHALTGNEKQHVNRWLLFGRVSPQYSWEMYDAAFRYCRARAGAPMGLSEVTQ